jgi:hypothetical protein
MQRDYNDPEYKKWRAAVRKRDKQTCKMPGCTTPKKKVVVHHIKRWVDYPELRFVVSNGICLCSNCHYKIKDKEQMYEEMFMRIITPINLDIRKMIRDYKK